MPVLLACFSKTMVLVMRYIAPSTRGVRFVRSVFKLRKLWLRVTKWLPQGNKASRWQGEFKLKPLALDHATPESLSPTLPRGPDESLALHCGRMPVMTDSVCDIESKWVLNCFGGMHPFESLTWLLNLCGGIASVSFQKGALVYLHCSAGSPRRLMDSLKSTCGFQG